MDDLDKKEITEHGATENTSVQPTINPSGRKYKVLMVDDDKFLLDMYSVKFTEGGLQVVTALRGEDAIEKIKAGYSPDIFMCDLVMPGMDGLELLEAIQKMNLLQKSAVIVLSNQGQQSDIDKASNLKVDGYIVKASSIPSEVFREVVKIADRVFAK
jgi:two-component system chemotaxis response regulator CheY